MTRTKLANSALATLLALLATAVAAGSPGVEDGEQLVQRFVNDIETLSATFEQVLIDANGDIMEQSSGTLDIQRPGRFRWLYLEPYEQWLVADGVNVWSYDVDLAQVTVKPQAEALANTPALLLGGSATALDGFRYDGSHQAGGLTWVRMIPNDTDSGFRHVELGFNGGNLERMVFLDNLEQITTVTLADVVTNEALDAARFEFVPPADVDVVGTPAVALDDRNPDAS